MKTPFVINNLFNINLQIVQNIPITTPQEEGIWFQVASYIYNSSNTIKWEQQTTGLKLASYLLSR